MSLAILPGTYDPMTLGHLELVRRARLEFDRVTVAIMVNPEKHCRFSLETRVKIAEATVSGISGVSVITDNGMQIDLFDRLGADAVCRGWRNEADLDFETRMADWNRAHNPRFRTVLYHTEGAFAHISSTVVRERIDRGETLDSLVHPAAVSLIRSAVNGHTEDSAS